MRPATAALSDGGVYVLDVPHEAPTASAGSEHACRSAVYQWHGYEAPPKPNALLFSNTLTLTLTLTLTRFLLAFLNALPTETTLRVWDLVFTIGARALFAAALATLRLLSPKLLSCDATFEDLYAQSRADHQPPRASSS